MIPVWMAFWCGTVVGAAAALFVAAVCMAAGDAEQTTDQGVSADDAQAMLNWAGDGESNLYNSHVSKPRPGSVRAVPE